MRTGALFTAVLSLGALFFSSSVGADPLSVPEKRGKQVYIRTTSPSGGKIGAAVGKSMMEAPGASLPCINCHGYDGVGLVESGVTATTITWEELTKPYGIRHSTGREHPPYTEETLARAITAGVDPAGNRLDLSMPRYQMSEKDLIDLMAYIKVLGTALDPGLTDTAIQTGTVLPLKGRMADMGRAMAAVLEAFFNDVNRGGGIYGRRIDLRAVAADETPATSIAEAVNRLVDREEVFALVSPFIAGADNEVALLAEEKEVPVFGPFTLLPEDVSLLNRFTFYIYSGLREHLRALAIFAAERFQTARPRAAVAYPEKGIASDVIESFERQMKKLGWHSMEKVRYAGGTPDAALHVKNMSQRQVGAFFFIGSWDDFKALMREADKIQWTPDVFLSASRVQSDLLELPGSFTGKVFLAYPTTPADHTEAGSREFNRFHKEHNLPKEHVAAQISSYCAAKIFVEGLKRTGKKLSREKLVSTMDKLTQFETGLTPRITYDPNRRIGAFGAHVLELDLEKKTFAPAGRWIELDPL